MAFNPFHVSCFPCSKSHTHTDTMQEHAAEFVPLQVSNSNQMFVKTNIPAEMLASSDANTAMRHTSQQCNTPSQVLVNWQIVNRLLSLL